MTFDILWRDVSISYAQKQITKTAVSHLNLELRPGEILGLLGPNGAGKTSLLSATTGLIGFQGGSIEVLGHRAGSLEAKSVLGVVPQETVSHGFFTVEEVLKFLSGLYGRRSNQRVIDDLLERLQLAEHRKKLVSQLSGGMKRRLLIAKALVHEPQILLLDEPSAGVDVELRTILWDFVRDLNKNSVSIVLTTHYLEEAERLCDRVAILDQGVLVAVDETGTLISSLSERQIKIRLRESLGSVRSQTGLVRILFFEGRDLHLQVPGAMGLKAVLDETQISLDQILDFQIEEGDLESAFLNLIRKKKIA